jgi:rare lipoprotein A
MHRRHFAMFGLLALIGSVPTEARGRTAKASTRGHAKRGVAVWYGEDRHGQTMANGRRFDQWAMTGASVHFALGARVRVTDLGTRKSVEVTITDYTIPGSRVLIDLSHAAGRALGIETKGKARVEVVPIGFDPNQVRQRQG